MKQHEAERLTIAIAVLVGAEFKHALAIALDETRLEREITAHDVLNARIDLTTTIITTLP